MDDCHFNYITKLGEKNLNLNWESICGQRVEMFRLYNDFFQVHFAFTLPKVMLHNFIFTHDFV
jgi:hypothetical protein